MFGFRPGRRLKKYILVCVATVKLAQGLSFTKFTNVCNELECFSLASLPSVVLVFANKVGAYPIGKLLTHKHYLAIRVP